MISDEKLMSMFEACSPGTKVYNLREFADMIIHAHEGGGRRIEGNVSMADSDLGVIGIRSPTGLGGMVKMWQTATLILHDPPQPKSAEERVREALVVLEDQEINHNREGCSAYRCRMRAILRGERP